MKHLVAPSLLSADFLNLRHDIDMVNASEADWFHLDVMDGVFVPNISFGFPIIRAVKALAKKPLDVHLMIIQPNRFITQFKEAGADILSVQVEACTHLHRVVHAIKDEGMKAGVVLNPHTPVESLQDIIADVDLVLLMSVNPGFGGQKFIENTFSRISRLKELILQKKSTALIEVDGGVGPGNAKKLVEAGVDVLVAGNSVFKASDPVAAIAALKNLA
jgi:ribulose-phosphate 3-epimerase